MCVLSLRFVWAGASRSLISTSITKFQQIINPKTLFLLPPPPPRSPSPLFTPSKAIPLAGLVSGRKVSYPGLASTEGGSNASSATAPLPPPPGTRQSPMKLIRKSLGWFSSGEGSPMQRPAGCVRCRHATSPIRIHWMFLR